LRNAVGGAAGGHGARDAGDSALVARRKMRIGGEDGEAVGRRHEARAADDEIAVAIAVGGRAKIGRAGRHCEIIQMFRVNQIGIG